ncbi:PREDICTED: uncharacterized protein LOC109238774 [Nicotiana attenuata]|uniref:uncharacterized protein LOC109238774 n=1 Tax=Nicotiana attenuata TaxID=49451 RepID=UPI00090501A9|nr:PREDICTED: uncharacterized protein LOC109238774 [Nicotiana attenuata]
MTAGHSSSFPAFSEKAIRDALNLKTSELGGVPSENDPFQVCFAGVDEADPADASSIFEEAQRLCSIAFDKLKTELRHCEAELHRASNEEKTLRLLLDKKEEELKHLRSVLTKAREYKSDLENKLWGKVDQVRAECNEWKAKMDTLVVTKNDAQAKAGRIAELEVGLAKAKAEVVEVQAEAREIQAKSDKTVDIYLKDATDAQMELRGASDREKRSNDYARRRSRRETLEEVHAKGFDLSEEIKQAKADEADAKFVLSSNDDDDVEDDEEEEVAEEATPGEEAGPMGVTGPGGMPLWCR